MEYTVKLTEKTGSTIELVMYEDQLDDVIERIGNNPKDLLRFSTSDEVYAVRAEDVLSLHAVQD